MTIEEAKTKRLKERGVGSYSVYRHTSPSGKVYIGITSMKPEQRWRKNGVGYKKQKYFFKAIKKYGWDSITHEVLFSNLTKKMACQLEERLIRHYKLMKASYNVALGGCLNYTRSKKVLEVNPKTGVILNEYFSIFCVAEMLKLAVSTVYMRCSGKCKQLINGSGWMYKSDYTTPKEVVERFKEYANESSWISIRKTKIAQVDVKTGKVLKIWENSKEVSKGLNLVNESAIHDCCRWAGKRKSVKGYLWVYEKDLKTLSKEELNNRINESRESIEIHSKKSIYQIDLVNKCILKEWGSIFEAVKETKIDSTGIWNCCNNRLNQYYAGGYGWRYKNDYDNLSEDERNKYLNKLSSFSKIIQLDLEANVLNIFKNIPEASKISGIDQNRIYSCVRKFCFKTGNYIFMYEVEYNSMTKSEIKEYVERVFNFGNKPILQYSKSGSFIKRWKSIKQASEELGISKYSISSNINGRAKTAGGFVFIAQDSIDDVTPDEFDKRRDKKKKRVSQYSLDGNKIKDWDNVTEAANSLGILKCNISSCAKGRARTAGGFVWKYID